MEPKDFWNNKHHKYALQDWIHVPTIFCQEVIHRFPNVSNILDLGSGQGQDTLYFAQHGHSVCALDFSDFALEQLSKLATEKKIDNIKTCLHDLREALPFADNEFDIVYSHLSMHYLTDQDTRKGFKEIARVLRKNGLLCILVNSIDDPEYGKGIQIEDDYYKVGDGDFKRYFSREYMFEVTKEFFLPYVLEAKGKTHKDPTDAFIKLIASRK